jgi:hypothetical protein
MPDSPSPPPAKPYSGPKADEVEKKVLSFLPGLRMYFPSKPEVASVLALVGVNATLAKGYSYADINAEIESEAVSRTFRNSAQSQVMAQLSEYARATLAEGNFAEKWPAILDTVARSDHAVAVSAAGMVLGDGFADAKVLAENQNAYAIARKSYFQQSIRQSIADLGMSQGAFEKRLREQPDYNDQQVEKNLVFQLDQYFYLTHLAGTFKTEWPAVIEQVTKFDPKLAAQAVGKFFENPQQTILLQGERALFVLPFEDLALAVSVAQQTAAQASREGHNAAAADAMVRVAVKLQYELAVPGREESELTALRGMQKTAMPAYEGYVVQGIKDLMAGQKAENQDAALKSDLLRLHEQYFYYTLNKGSFEGDWPAKIAEASAFDPALGVVVASSYFKNPQGTLPIANYARAYATAEKACAVAAEKGNCVLAADTMAQVINQLRMEFEKQPREIVTLGKMAVSALAAREGFLIQGIDNALSGLTAAANGADASIADGLRDDLRHLMNDYLHFTVKTPKFLSDWPVKMNEVTAFDPALAAEGLSQTLRNSQFYMSASETALACERLRDAALKAKEKGNNAIAADALANAVRHVRFALMTPDLEAEKAAPLRALQESITADLDSLLPLGIKDAIADLNISDEEFAKRRSESKNYNDDAAEARLMALLDEYFYYTLRKGTLQNDWAAELNEVSSFDTDLAAQAAGVFFRRPQMGLTTMADFNNVCAAAEEASEKAGKKGFYASAAQTMADILVAIHNNIVALKDREDILPQLQETGKAAAEKFKSIMDAWALAAFNHPGDRRSPEEIETAENAIQNFVRSLKLSEMDVGIAAPPPTPGAPA